VGLKKCTYGLMMADVEVATLDFVVLHLMLHPWRAPATERYPVERIRIAAWSNGQIAAVPDHRDRRPWLHRFPDSLQQLCLWDPWDPVALRWSASDGVGAYVHIVHRHLQAEEFWRRQGRWPVEDSPHGNGPHPIRSQLMHDAVLAGVQS
jgi:hypothetical protein